MWDEIGLHVELVPHVRIDLMSRLLGRRQGLLANKKHVEHKVLDGAAREQLRALGYIQ